MESWKKAAQLAIAESIAVTTLYAASTMRNRKMRKKEKEGLIDIFGAFKIFLEKNNEAVENTDLTEDDRLVILTDNLQWLTGVVNFHIIDEGDTQ